jgi:4-hydroxy-tetrahydrodipicolinate synthase
MVPTPFGPGGDIVDQASLRRVASSFVESGCDGLAVLGIIGEPSSLTETERVSVVAEVAGHVPVPVIAGAMVGTADSVLADAANMAAEVGGLLSAVMAPVLYPNPADLRSWLCQLHERTGLPVVVQDLPRYSGVHIAVEDLAEALVDLGFVRGVKCEASPTYRRIAQLAARGVKGLMSGLGGRGLVADLTAGATEVAIGVTVPGAVVAASRSWTAGEDTIALAHLGRYAGLIDYETQQGPSIAVRKEHWRRQGVLSHGDVRPPTSPWTADLAPISAALGAG